MSTISKIELKKSNLQVISKNTATGGEDYDRGFIGR